MCVVFFCDYVYGFDQKESSDHHEQEEIVLSWYSDAI